MSILEIKNFSFYYPNKSEASVKNVNLTLKKNSVTALIGPSGCGKSTLLRSVNRICDITEGNRYTGEIIFKGKNILKKNLLISLLTSLKQKKLSLKYALLPLMDKLFKNLCAPQTINGRESMFLLIPGKSIGEARKTAFLLVLPTQL